MVQTIKTQPSDSLRGVALLDDPIRNKGQRSLQKNAANTGSKAFCRIRWKALTGRSSA